MISSFGGIVFETSIDKLYPIDGINIRTGIKFEEQEVEGGLPKLYVKSMDLQELSFKVKLMRRLGVDIDAELQRWDGILKSKAGQDFILNNKKQGSKWILTNYSVDEIIPGEVVELSVEAKQFAGYGAKKEKENDKKTKSKKVKEKRETKMNPNVPIDTGERRRKNKR